MPLSVNLYNLSQKRQDLLDAILEEGGELTPENEKALRITDVNMNTAAIDYAGMIKQLADAEDACNSEIDRLKAIKVRIIKSAALLEKQIKEAMLHFEVEKIETPTLKISFRRSKAVEVYDHRLVPPEYWVTKPEISKLAIRAAMDRGREVPGAWLIEHKNLQIK